MLTLPHPKDPGHAKGGDRPLHNHPAPMGLKDSADQHMQTTETSGAGDDLLVLTRALPSRTQKLLAFVVVPGILAVVFIISRPFAGVQLRAIDAFVPFYVTAIFLNNLITSVLLFAQFSILRTRALLVIANGYLFAGLMIIPYTLSFPGVFEPGQSLIGGLQSTPWLYILRHCGFAMFVVAFALLRDFDVNTPYRHISVRQSIFPSFAATVAVVLAAAFVCIAGDTLLPTIINDRSHFDATWVYYAGGPITSLYVLALILLWFRRHTVLGLWLMVVACVHLAGVPLSFYPPPIRFSVGWYTVVIINLIANSLVLVVLLVEISKLYARHLLAVRAQHREREARLVTGDAVSAMIAHEVKQPLSAMITRAETSLRRLNRSIPDLDKAKEEIKQIVADGYRAGVVIDSIRANFKKDARVRTSVDVNGLIAETMDLVRSDLQKHRILLRSEPRVELPQVAADRSQLQQVLLNLITNAIDSMAAEDGARILSVTSEFYDNSEIVVSVADTGSGINSQDSERVFNPLFTTKSRGMGMGLSICRSIIEAHDGRIWVESNNPKGAVFQFALSPEILNT
jgi:signal transduction histidine kinase